MSAEFEIRPGLIIHRWSAGLADNKPPNHLRWNVTDVFGNVPELTREDIRKLYVWFLEESVSLHKEE